MGGFRDVFPRPREVPLAGGRVRARVDEVRVGDLADLDDWLAQAWPDPADDLAERVRDLDPDARREALTAAWDLAEAGPPTWGEPRGEALLATGAGVLETFRLALRAHHPELAADHARLAEVAAHSTPSEYDGLMRAWRRVDPAREIQWLLDVDPGVRGQAIPWSQAVMEVCEAYGWTPDEVERLTMTQFRLARTGGKPDPGGTVVAPKTNLVDVLRAARERLFGPTRKPPAEAR